MSLVKIGFCENELIKEAEYLEKVAAELNECSDEDLVKIAEEIIRLLKMKIFKKWPKLILMAN